MKRLGSHGLDLSLGYIKTGLPACFLSPFIYVNQRQEKKLRCESRPGMANSVNPGDGPEMSSRLSMARAARSEVSKLRPCTGAEQKWGFGEREKGTSLTQAYETSQ